MQTAQKITSFLVDELHWEGEPLTPDMELLETSVLDSMGIFQLVSYIESEFGVEVRDEDLVPERFNTINDIVALVESLRSGNVA